MGKLAIAIPKTKITQLKVLCSGKGSGHNKRKSGTNTYKGKKGKRENNRNIGMMGRVTKKNSRDRSTRRGTGSVPKTFRRGDEKTERGEIILHTECGVRDL